MTYAEWKLLGLVNGWLYTPEGHESLDRPDQLPLTEWSCAAHNEGQLCCLDHKDVYHVKEYR